MNTKLLTLILAFAIAQTTFLADEASATNGAADVQEMRNTMFGTIVLMSAGVSAFGIIWAYMSRNPEASFPMPDQPLSTVVPPAKQESNIVHCLVQS